MESSLYVHCACFVLGGGAIGSRDTVDNELFNNTHLKLHQCATQTTYVMAVTVIVRDLPSTLIKVGETVLGASSVTHIMDNIERAARKVSNTLGPRCRKFSYFNLSFSTFF